MRFWSSIVAVAALLGSASRADAMCAPPIWVGTPDGAQIPTRGSLYVYAGEWSNGAHMPIELGWIGAEGFVELTEIEPEVFKLTYSGMSGSELVVGKGEHARHYKLTDTWRAPNKAPTALAITHHEAQGCGDSDGLRVKLDQPTAAVRIRWTFGERTREWIMPAWDDVVEIGQIGCGKTTVPSWELDDGGHLELISIRVDGSEATVRGIPSRIAARSGEIDTDPLGVPDVPQLKREQTPRDLPIPTNLIAIAIALLVAALGFARLWLRHALAKAR